MLFTAPPSDRLPPPRRPTGKPDEPRLDELSIDTGWSRRWLGIVGYLLYFAIVAGVLIYLFFQFTDSLKLAFVLVVFMVGYMSLMGWIAMRKNANHGGNLE